MGTSPFHGGSLDEYFSIYYEDLRLLAHHRLQRNETVTLLQTTALVNESYLRFLKAGRLEIADRSQFVAFAAHVMRSIVVDFVRGRHAKRRGADQTVALDTESLPPGSPEDEVIRVNEALDELAKVDARLVKVVEMRYFGGLEEQEIAAAMDVTDRTVRRYWEKARLLLSLALQ